MVKLSLVAISRIAGGFGKVIERRSIEFIALPPNKALQPTSQLVTPFACAKGAPSCLAAEL